MLKRLRVTENWLTDSIKSRKWKYFGLMYFGLIKSHNDIENIILEDIMLGRRKRGCL